MLSPSTDSTDALYREKILAARAMSEEERVLAGPRMFDAVCDEIRRRIRATFPGATEDHIGALCRVSVEILYDCWPAGCFARRSLF